MGENSEIKSLDYTFKLSRESFRFITMKWSVNDWHANNKAKVFHAERSRKIVESLRDETQRAIEETDKHTKNTQRQTTTRLEQRINRVDHWTDEINEKLDGLNNEIDALCNFKTRVENALAATIEPLHINRECQVLRQQRIATDDCDDPVDRDLAKEIGVIQSSADLLKVTLAKINEQIRKDRSARYYLEKDHKDKTTALGLDKVAKGLHNNSHSAQHRPQTAFETANRNSNPLSWQNFTEVNVAKAEKERSASKDLRSAVDSILRQTSDDMIEQNQLTTFQFNERIAETKSARNKLAINLDDVMSEVGRLEVNINDLEKALKDKEGPMMVCETRAHIRQERPNVEYCIDAPHVELRKEVQEIQGSISRLKILHSESQIQMKDLLRQQLTLQEEIKVKDNTIYIDEVCCKAKRESIKLTYY